MPKLILVRGVPGSGKTTFARNNYPGVVDDAGEPDKNAAYMISADDFRIDECGNYVHDDVRGDIPHVECQARVREAITAGCPQIIVHNTFIKVWEIEPYVKISHACKVPLEVICMPNISAEEAFSRNTHNVPISVIKRMIDEMQDFPGQRLLF